MLGVTDFRQYYNLEEYLFGTVTARFQEQRVIGPFDFFCIVIWKANRSKSRIAERLLTHGGGYTDLDSAVGSLLSEVQQASDPKGRLAVLVEDWGFRLPMASAILTVLYPDEFTVYDVRVCNVLGDFDDAKSKTNFVTMWNRYSAYIDAVRRTVKDYPILRDKDRYLWGQSFAQQLEADIADQFKRARLDDEGLDP